MKVTKEDFEVSGMPKTKDSVLAYRMLEKERREPRELAFLAGFAGGVIGGIPFILLVWFVTSWFTEVIEIRALSTAVTVVGFLAAVLDASQKYPENNTRLTYDNKVPVER